MKKKKNGKIKKVQSTILQYIETYSCDEKNDRCILIGGMAFNSYFPMKKYLQQSSSIDIDIYNIQPLHFLVTLGEYLEKKYPDMHIYIIEALHKNTFTLLIDHYRVIDATSISCEILEKIPERKQKIFIDKETSYEIPVISLEFFLIDILRQMNNWTSLWRRKKIMERVYLLQTLGEEKFPYLTFEKEEMRKVKAEIKRKSSIQSNLYMYLSTEDVIFTGLFALNNFLKKEEQFPYDVLELHYVGDNLCLF